MNLKYIEMAVVWVCFCGGVAILALAFDTITGCLTREIAQLFLQKLKRRLEK